MQPKNSAVLFDLDGTLINSGLSFLKIINELKVEESQDPVNFEIVREFSSRGASLILKNAFPQASDEKIDALKLKFLRRYAQIMTSDIHVYEGVEELLKKDFDATLNIEDKPISTVELINFTPFGRHIFFLRYCPNAVASK